MKKLLPILLSIMLVLGIAGCGEKGDSSQAKLKFGMGVYAYTEESTSADADTNGKGSYTATVAAVLIDSDGKIVDSAIDTVANTVEFTSEGKALSAEGFKTKYEKGEEYGMKKYAGSENEWYEQADNFTFTIKGKTLDEVKALVAKDGKGTEEVVNGGCTITISDFVKAVEKAINNASDSDATKDDSVKLGVITSQTEQKDATAEESGVIELATTVSAVAKGKDNKAAAVLTDAFSVKFTFDSKGVIEQNESNITTKLEAKENYGMKAYGGSEKEWYEQVDAFNKTVAGKTASEISAMVTGDGYGNSDIQNAGCTIKVADMISAVVKAASADK